MSGLLYANLGAGAAVIAVLILRKLFKNKILSKIYVLLWALIIIRLLLPIEISSPVSIYPSFESGAVQIVSASVPEAAATPAPPESINTEKDPAEGFGEKERNISFSFKKAAFAVWLFGGIFIGGFFALRHFYAVKRIKSACLPFGSLPEGFFEFCDSSSGKIRFLKSKNIVSPLSFGIFRPTIVVPESVSESQLPFVLLHEYIHTRDRDAALKATALAALSVNWFNPLVWAAVRYLDRDLERYCDERVLALMGKEKASEYAGVILDFAEKQSFSASLSYFNAASLKERVISIMKIKNRRRRPFATCAMLLAVAALIYVFGTKPASAATNLGQTLSDYPDGYLGYSAGNKYVTSSFTPTSNEKVKTIVIRGFDFSDSAEASIECIHSERIFIDFVYGDVLRAHGFNVEQNGSEIIISTSESCSGIDERFSLRIFADFYEVQVISKNIEPTFSAPTKIKANTSTVSAYPDWHRTWSFSDVFDSNWEAPLSDCGGLIWMPQSAVEIPALLGENVYAMDSGTVLLCDLIGGYGNTVIIDHENGYISVYGHCDEFLVSPGDFVAKGEAIATAGNTGNSIFPVSLYIDVLYDEETVFYVDGDFKTSLEHYRKKLELSRQ